MDPGTGYPVTKASQPPPLSETQIADITAKFKAYDKDGNGTLDKQELRALLETTLKRKITDKMFESYTNLIVSANDKNANGLIELDEFISLFSKIHINPELPIHMGARPGLTSSRPLESGSNSPKTEKGETLDQLKERVGPEVIEEARQSFIKFDKDGSGTIDKEELKELLKQTMSKRMSDMIIRRYVDAQFALYDKDGSGHIDVDEFLALYVKMYLTDDKNPISPPGAKQSSSPKGSTPPTNRVKMPGM
eukprot:TRINITY_DN1315_c0_g1_i1.p1 TRINITY_DN1315_c0_g1~~TRINITY_DN1315_c0_g1_i1.p1  ORF type:complete len:250 (+),score=73.95 TRINITY_DN1315_c0_g1_i1:51-800(+)